MNDPADMIDLLRREVIARHGATPGCVRVVRAPYRVCPLGAHVDHQLGPVTAMAIDRGVYLAYAPSGSGEVVVSSLDFPGVVRFGLGDVPGRHGDDWGNFPRGAARALSGRYPLGRGLVGVTAGRLHGGGVSSSAAVGVAFLLALEDVNGLRVPAAENIELARRIETDYLGLRIGILDPAAILLSRRGHLTRIDCRTAAHGLIPAAPGLPPWRVLLAFSGLRRALVGTDYNRRVAECAEAARTLLAALGREGGDPVLGDVAPDEYLAYRYLLRGAPARRAAHFFSEVERVRRGVEAWRSGDLAGFGALMTASGASSIHNYECGSPPLIDLYQTLIATEGVHGARFSGAGFRGCCVALVDSRAVDQAADRVGSIYRRMHPDLADHALIMACDSDDGAALVEPAKGEDWPRASASPLAPHPEDP
jgi:galacturonokinase